jgi:hypothetical protein
LAKKDRVAGKIQIDRESPEFKARVQRSRESKQKRKEEAGDTPRGRAKRAFGERLLGSYGLGKEDFAEGGFVKGKLGLFAEAINNKPDTQAAPEMERAKTESNKSNPNISALTSQLESLVKVASRVGVVTTEQQRSYQQQMTTSTRQARERSMEGGIATLLASMMGTGTSLDPLTTEVGTLIEKIKPLQDAIEEQSKKAEEESNKRGFVERLADRYGLGDDYRDYDKKKQAIQSRVKTKPGFKMTRTRTGQTRFVGPDGRFVSRAAAVADAVPTRLQRATSAVRSGGAGLLNLAKRSAVATRVGGAKIVSGTSKNIASIVGKGMKVAGATASATKSVSASVVKRIAGPIITKAIGSTVLKSIPIVGAVAGGLFAAKKLVQGDVVGAGLEAASGLAGPLTAIPAMIASVARDTYSSVFGLKPESDPNFVSRMALITGLVGALVTSMLASKVEAKQKPTQSQIDKATIPEAKPNATVTAGTTPSGAPKPVPSAPAPKSAPSPSPSPSSTPTPTPTPKSSSSSSSGTASTKSTPSGSNMSGVESYMKSSQFQETLAGEKGIPSASPSQMSTIVETPPATSEALSRASAEAEAASRGVSVINIGGNNARPLPSKAPPTRSGVSGAGDVPDPHYFGIGQVADGIYFNANPSTMP